MKLQKIAITNKTKVWEIVGTELVAIITTDKGKTAYSDYHMLTIPTTPKMFNVGTLPNSSLEQMDLLLALKYKKVQKNQVLKLENFLYKYSDELFKCKEDDEFVSNFTNVKKLDEMRQWFNLRRYGEFDLFIANLIRIKNYLQNWTDLGAIDPHTGNYAIGFDGRLIALDLVNIWYNNTKYYRNVKSITANEIKRELASGLEFHSKTFANIEENLLHYEMLHMQQFDSYIV